MINQWNSSLAKNCEKLTLVIKEFLENRQSCGEIIRYKVSPHLKQILMDNQKKFEERKQSVVEKGGKEGKQKDKDKEGKEKDKPTAAAKQTKSKSVERIKSAKSEPPKEKTQEEDEEAIKIKLEEENKFRLLKELAKLRQENCNMICYGIPDIYFTN